VREKEESGWEVMNEWMYGRDVGFVYMHGLGVSIHDFFWES
jgi:hypothetical protein